MLVAISIPIFTSQLEKSREATDAANIRSAYAEIMTAAITDDLPSDMSTYDVTLKQQQDDWSTTFDLPENLKQDGKPGKGKKASFTYDADAEQVTVKYE